MTGLGPHETQPLRSARGPSPRSDGATRNRISSTHAPRSPGWTTATSEHLRLRSLPQRAPAPSAAPEQPAAQEAAAQAQASATQQRARSTIAPVATDGMFDRAVHVADRAVRITMDAIIILVFSPVIAAWWLIERRRRKDRV